MPRYKVNPDDILKLTIAKAPYVDRMNVWFIKKPLIDLDYIEKFCGRRPIVNEKKMRHSAAPFTRKVRYQLLLFQPTIEAVRYLADVTGYLVDYYINYVEIALDFIARTQENVKPIRRFFDTCWVKRWHVKKKLVRTANGDYDYSNDIFANVGTTYYSPRKATVNYVTYSDKPSKMNGMPCCHLEVRLNEHPTFRRLGLDSFEAYLTPNFFYSFWQKHLHLKMVKDRKSINGSVEKIVRKKKHDKSEDEIKRTIQTILRIFNYDSYSAQVICDFGKYVDGKRRFTTVLPNEKFLPPKESMIVSKNIHNNNKDTTNRQQTITNIPIRDKTTTNYTATKRKKLK